MDTKVVEKDRRKPVAAKVWRKQGLEAAWITGVRAPSSMSTRMEKIPASSFGVEGDKAI